MKLGMGEILANASDKDSAEEAMNYLRQNQSPMFCQMLKMAYDPNLVWDLPEGNVPYKPSELTDTEGMLVNEVRRMYLFHVGGHPTLSQMRKQQLFVDMLECLDKNDAKLVVSVRNKTLDEDYPGITKEFIDATFPGLLVY